MNSLPDEMILHLLNKFSVLELCQFRPPEQRFQTARNKALNSRIKTLLTEKCLAEIPRVTLSQKEQYEGIPTPNMGRFKKKPVITGVTTLGRRFLSVSLKNENNQCVIWTTYQRWVGKKEDYWKMSQYDVVSERKVPFVTDDCLVKLAKIFLGKDPRYLIHTIH